MSDDAERRPDQSAPHTVWKLDAVMQRLGDDEALLDDLIGFFLEDSPELCDRIRDAIAAGDTHEIQRNAHALKGLCANFEAAAAAAAAGEVENLAAQGKWDANAYDLATTEAQVRILAEALSLWRAERNGG